MITVSIITPTYHREALLLEAIASVQKIKGISFEMLICDDSPEGSAEPFVAMVKDPRIRYSKNPMPTGGYPAVIRNRLVQQAEGRFLYFLDDDDRVVAETLVAMVAALEQSSAAVAIGDVRPFSHDAAALAHETDYFAKAKATLTKHIGRKRLAARLLFSRPVLVCSCCLIKKESFLAIGGFDTTIALCEDMEMYLRALRSFGFIYLPQVLLERRCGESSLILHGSKIQFLESYQKIYANYCERFGLLEFYLLKLYGWYLKREEP